MPFEHTSEQDGPRFLARQIMMREMGDEAYSAWRIREATRIRASRAAARAATESLANSYKSVKAKGYRIAATNVAEFARAAKQNHYVEDFANAATTQHGSRQPRNRKYENGGEAPPTRNSSGTGRGKQRSFALRDMGRPSLDDRHGAPASQRIGGLMGSSRGGGQRGTAVFSNFGAQKDFGSSPLGWSAGRVRGMKTLFTNPGVFANRFLWVFVASEASKAAQNWRSWEKISWTMSPEQAAAKLELENTPEKMLAKAGGVVAQVGGAALDVVGTIGVGILAAAKGVTSLTGIPGLASMFSEAQLAQGAAHLSAWVDYVKSGLSGQNPLAAAAALNENMNDMLEARKRNMERQVRARLIEGMEKNLTISQNDKRVLAVGGADEILRATLRTPEFESRLKLEIARARINDDDGQTILENMLNKMVTGQK